MKTYRNHEKLKLILMAIRENSEANGRLVNMAWQELGKPVKPATNPVRQSSKMSRGDEAIIRVLSSKVYPVTLRTIAKETGLAPKTCSMGLWRLRKAGYNIQTSYDRSRQGKYLLRCVG
jgi:hypothetical protein